MAIRTGLNTVNCVFDAACGAIIQATDINSINDGAKAAAERGDTVLNVAGLGQINLFDTYQVPDSELWKSTKELEFENAGYGSIIWGVKFRLDPYVTSGSVGCSRVVVVYVAHTGAETTLLDASTNTGVWPTSTLYAADTLTSVKGTASVPAEPASGETEWHKIRVEYWQDDGTTWDKEFQNDNGVAWLYVKLHNDCP